MRGTFTYGDLCFPYEVRFAARRTMSISVYPDCTIAVTAPAGTEQQKIERLLKKRARWIVRQRRHFEQFKPRTTPRKYVGGETHLYLGRQYRLQILLAEHASVKLKAGRIVVTSSDDNRDKIKELVAHWYRERARLKLAERFAAVAQKFERLIPVSPDLILRSMKVRWGSHTASGRIILNNDLIRAPVHCIDYVVTHELAHVVHPNHGASFFKLLEAMMPDWSDRKQKLETLLS